MYHLNGQNTFGSRGATVSIDVTKVPHAEQKRTKQSALVSGTHPQIVMQTRDCVLVKNVVIRGDGWLQNENNANQTSIAECDLQPMVSAKYELFVKYASEESRPVRVTLNNNILQEKALAASTGGWEDPNSVDQTLGTVEVTNGKNILQFYSEHGFPHIQQIRFVKL